MNIFDWFYRQIVSQSQLDWAFEQVQAADHDQSVDNSLVGILSGMDITENSPTPDLTVNASAGVAYDNDGQRMALTGVLTNIDCSMDEYGVSTTVTSALNERWISIFVRFERDLTEPAVDGNSLTVYTKQIEDLEVFVRQAAEQVIGTDLKPPILSDAILLCDIYLLNGQTSILNTHINYERREDFARVIEAAPHAITEWSAGTAAEGLLDLFGKFNDHISDLAYPHTAAGISFTPTEQWNNGDVPQGASAPVTTIAEDLDAIVYDLAHETVPTGGGAARIGVDTDTMPYGNIAWSAGSLWSLLVYLATELDDVIEWAAEVDSEEILSGPWHAKSFEGGTVSPSMSNLEWIEGDMWLTYSYPDKQRWAMPFSSENQRWVLSTAWRPVDIIPGWSYTRNEPCIYVLNANYVSGSTYDREKAIMEVDIFNWQGTQWDTGYGNDDPGCTYLQPDIDAGDEPRAFCSDGPYLYILCDQGGGGTTSNVYRYALNPWTGSYLWKRNFSLSCGSGFPVISRIRCKSVDELAILFEGENVSSTPIVHLKRNNSAYTTHTPLGPGGTWPNPSTTYPSGGLCQDGIQFEAAGFYDATASAPYLAFTNGTNAWLVSLVGKITDCEFDGMSVWAVQDTQEVHAWGFLAGEPNHYGGGSMLGTVYQLYREIQIRYMDSAAGSNRRPMLCFDGQRMWCQFPPESDTSDWSRKMLVNWPAGMVHGDWISAAPNCIGEVGGTSVLTNSKFISVKRPFAETSDIATERMAYTHGQLWMIVHGAGGQMYVCRLPGIGPHGSI